ncbi:hypothetical protein [Mycolicibacterium elephantis]|uniref:hypothetical protein n=1 Tax=Mycolicibacterium elephantis TaxID=81858 RepID=UPI001055F9C0|nr:hypothetical protein [Mycolicibacterium elephantis]
MSYYPNRTDVLTAFHSIGLDPAKFVITAGVVESPTLADTAAQLYRAGWRTVVGPDALRCHAYTVTEIYTDTAATFDYNVPVHNMPTL